MAVSDIFTMSVGMLLFWTVLLTVGVLLYRTLSRGSQRPHTPAGGSPETAGRASCSVSFEKMEASFPGLEFPWDSK